MGNCYDSEMKSDLYVDRQIVQKLKESNIKVRREQ